MDTVLMQKVINKSVLYQGMSIPKVYQILFMVNQNVRTAMEGNCYMEERIKEIRAALNEGLYYVALSLSLVKGDLVLKEPEAAKWLTKGCLGY